MEIKQSVSEYLINLIRCTIRNEKPLEKPEDITWKEVYDLAVYHKVEEMAFYSAAKVENKPEGEEANLWLRSHENNEILDLIQTEEAKTIIEEVTKSNIGILPLKGYLMKPMYRMNLFRQMADLDYLIEPGKVDDVVEIMKNLGYEPDDVGLEDSHDVYKKRPYMEVEMHRRLLPPTEENHWHTDDIWDRLVTDEYNSKLMHMTWEDYYLFHLLHFEKHYSMGGSGIRSIIDQYYLMENIFDKLDWNYVNPILEKMNYVGFEKMCRDLAQAWFGEGVMTEELKAPAEYIINSGVFGTFEQYQKWSFEKYKKEQGIKSKKGFFLRRMFMERERMEFIYPSLKKHGWLLPFLWIHRLFKSVFFNWKRVKMELNNFFKK